MKSIKLFSIIAILIAMNSCKKDNSNTPKSPIYNSIEYLKTDTLKQIRVGFACAAAGSKVLFAGGAVGGYDHISKTVDIYDAITGKWDSSQLSQERFSLTAASIGNKILFVGGRVDNNTNLSDVVDIYDVTTGNWTTSQLSHPMHSCAAASIGNKIFFAGGISQIQNPDLVDIYDVSTDNWLSSHLSQGRIHLAIASAGNKILFAGGLRGNVPIDSLFSDRVDIYDLKTDKWSSSHLSQGRSNLTATSSGNRIFFAGGEYSTNISSNVIDIYDVTTGKWTIDHLSQASGYLQGISVSNKIIFAGGQTDSPTMIDFSYVIDIFDINTNKWKSDLCTTSGLKPLATLGNKVYFSNGQFMDTYVLK